MTTTDAASPRNQERERNMTKKTETEMTHAETITCMRVGWLEDRVAAMHEFFEEIANEWEGTMHRFMVARDYLDAIEAVDCDQDAHRIDPNDAAAAAKKALAAEKKAAKKKASATKKGATNEEEGRGDEEECRGDEEEGRGEEEGISAALTTPVAAIGRATKRETHAIPKSASAQHGRQTRPQRR